MKKFNEIFGKVMIEVTPTEVAMLGAEVPVVAVNGHSYAEFVTWANKSFSPNLMLNWASNNSGCCVVAEINGVFNEKSASTLRANGFTEWAIQADDKYDEDGRPLGCPGLYINFPCDDVQSI